MLQNGFEVKLNGMRKRRWEQGKGLKTEEGSDEKKRREKSEGGGWVAGMGADNRRWRKYEQEQVHNREQEQDKRKEGR